MKSEVCLFFFIETKIASNTLIEREKKKQIKAKSKFLPRVVITIMKKKKKRRALSTVAPRQQQNNRGCSK